METIPIPVAPVTVTPQYDLYLCYTLTEWLSGDVAWSMQVGFFFLKKATFSPLMLQDQLPKGAMLLRVILSSNKTNLSSITGGCVAYPLLISLTNLLIDFCTKATNHAFHLLSLLPTPKFIHEDRKTCGILENCLIYYCLDFILQPLKKAAQVGIMMSDPLGSL